MIGSELLRSPQLSNLEKLYIRLLGIPISGLRIRLRRVLPHLVGKANKVLDAGCGRGVFSYELAKRFPNASTIGIDLDPEQIKTNIEVAKENQLTNLTFEVQNVMTLPYQDEFDFILSVDNLEHLEDDEKGIRQLFQALKHGGRLVLHVPGLERRWFFYKFKTNFDVPGHFRPGYKLEDISQKIRDAGFIIDEAYYTFGWLETITNNISYLITKAEAKNKIAYALVFPILNFIAWFGQHTRPKNGAGVLLLARKPNTEIEP